MRTLGVDLSADPANTAACQIDWVAGTISLFERPLTDDSLVMAIAVTDMAAIDVPLGWPDAFVEAVVAHRDGASWPPAASPPPADREPLRFRTTDLLVRAAGAKPLSVSTDRIGVAAMRGARLQHLLRSAGIPIDRSGTSGPVVEAYPAAALRAWGLTSSGYKGPRNAEIRQALADAVSEQFGPLASAAQRCLDRCDDDDLDALICAVVARAAKLGHTARPKLDQLEAARREGWIHVPTTDIDVIVRGVTR